MFIFISFRLKLNSKNRQPFSVALSLAVATNTLSPTHWTKRRHLKRAMRTKVSWESRWGQWLQFLVPTVSRRAWPGARPPLGSLCVCLGVPHSGICFPVFLSMCFPQETRGHTSHQFHSSCGSLVRSLNLSRSLIPHLQNRNHNNYWFLGHLHYVVHI